MHSWRLRQVFMEHLNFEDELWIFNLECHILIPCLLITYVGKLYPRFPQLCTQVVYLLSLCFARENADTAVVIWGMDVFINQPIECEIYFEFYSCLDMNFAFFIFLLSCIAQEEQSICKHDPQEANINKIGVSFHEINLKAFFLDVVAFFKQNLHQFILDTCKLSVSHHQIINSSLQKPD